ncbi:hypothetical protein [Aliiroseovarius sp.]|uniref:hypothetical protein n=1 Tax=Aliiroseovarius sp. TaxID=1872442 RepID=UPI003BA90BAD
MPCLMRLLAPLAFAVSPALAQEGESPIRPDDQPMDQAALSAAVTGQTLTFFDGGESRFETDGKYSWTYGEGGTWLGHYAVGEDSTICITFVTGVERCDLYVQNGERLVLITQDGMRFPVKDIR